MDRGSTKHGPARDEQMKHEVGAKDPETAGDDDELGNTGEGGAPPGMTYDEVEQRSRLGRYIPMSSLPGSRDDLLVGANELNAPDDILDTLATLPADEVFQTVSEVWAALGHHNEDVRHRT
jgi:hypothetical protein